MGAVLCLSGPEQSASACHYVRMRIDSIFRRKITAFLAGVGQFYREWIFHESHVENRYHFDKEGWSWRLKANGRAKARWETTLSYRRWRDCNSAMPNWSVVWRRWRLCCASCRWASVL